MAPLPKRKWSSRRQGKHRASLKLKPTGLINCQNCGSLKKPHTVCPSCGQYNKQQIVVKKEKTKKKTEAGS